MGGGLGEIIFQQNPEFFFTLTLSLKVLVHIHVCGIKNNNQVVINCEQLKIHTTAKWAYVGRSCVGLH